MFLLHLQEREQCQYRAARGQRVNCPCKDDRPRPLIFRHWSSHPQDVRHCDRDITLHSEKAGSTIRFGGTAWLTCESWQSRTSTLIRKRLTPVDRVKIAQADAGRSIRQPPKFGAKVCYAWKADRATTRILPLSSPPKNGSVPNMNFRRRAVAIISRVEGRTKRSGDVTTPNLDCKRRSSSTLGGVVPLAYA